MGGRGSPMPPVDVQSGPLRNNAVTQEGRRTGSGSSTASSKQSPAKTVAGALKKLFRLSSDKGADSPAHNSTPSPNSHGSAAPQQPPLQQAVSSPVAIRSSVEAIKSSSFKNSPSMEPTSILDYDERFSALTERPSAQSAITDRTSVLTSNERASSLRDSKSTVLSRSSSRASSSSRLGTYIRSIIKSGTSTTVPASGTHQAAGSPPASPGSNAPGNLHAQQLHDSPTKTPSGSSPFQASSQQAAQHGPSIILGSNVTTAPAAHAPQANAPQRGLFTNMPAHSNPPQPQVHPSSSPRGLYDNSLVLPPPSASALQRMQRDPNLLTVCNDLPASMDRPSWRVEDYTVLQKVHAGYASAVYKAYCRHSGQTVALKVYQPAKLHEISQYQLYREARLHTQMNHPNIIKLYAAFRHGDNVVLVQEFADGGDLLQLLMQHGTRLSERRATQLVLQPLLRALYYLHSRFIVHRDVKLENILFTGREMTLKVADFGLCLNLREERSVTRAGTLDYMAPEVLRCPQKHKPQDNKERLDLAYDMTVDIWALGVVGYELLNGCPPFTCHDKKETEKRITSGLMPEFVVDVSEAAREFVYSCLARFSEQRPTAWQLLRNPWLKSGTRSSQPTLMESLHAHRMARAAAAAAAGASSSSHQVESAADTHRQQQQQEAERAAVKAAAVPSSSSLPSAARTHAAHEAAAAAAAMTAAAGQKQHEQLPSRASAPTPGASEQAAAAASAAARPATASTAAKAGAGTHITASNYAPGRVAAAYAQLQAVVDGDDTHDGGAISPTAARPAGSPTGRNSLSARNSQPLVPTSQLVHTHHQQQQAQPSANRFPAPYTNKMQVRTSAPAASALKALQAAAAAGGVPVSPSTPDTAAAAAGSMFGPPHGLSPIQTSPAGKRLSSPNTPRTPSSMAALAAQAHGPFSIPIPDEDETGQPVYEGLMQSHFPPWLTNMTASFPRAPYGVPLLPNSMFTAGALPSMAPYGGLPHHPAMASMSWSRRSLDPQLHMAGTSSVGSTMMPVGASYALDMVRDALMSRSSKLLPRHWASQATAHPGSMIAAVHSAGAVSTHQPGLEQPATGGSGAL